MQLTEVEREAAQSLPRILGELFEQHVSQHALSLEGLDRDIDFTVEAGERQWLVQVKNSSSPGAVSAAAERFAAKRWPEGAVPLLVVPFMTPSGAKTAEARRLNWVDLSGNAQLRDEGLVVWVQGHPNRFATRGRPASPFAPKSSRIVRTLLLDPSRWWRQKELAEQTDLDPSRVSRVVHGLDREELLLREGHRLRPRDPDLLLDAWADEYRFERHDIIAGHVSGNGMEVVRTIHDSLFAQGVDHAFTGLPAAWLVNKFAQFRVVSIYVSGDPRNAAQAIGMRRNERGSNVQLIGPNDRGVFDGKHPIEGLPCVAPVQIYLDLQHLPERAMEAASQLRSQGSLWHG